jgi:hypothetical protein
MIDSCNLEALPKEPQFRIHMKDFPKSSLTDLHLFKGQKLEEISKDFYPEDLDMASITPSFNTEVESRQGASLQTLIEQQGPIVCLDLPEVPIEK